MNELIEKLEHALMVCQVANTRLLNLTAEDGKLILQALKTHEAPARLLTPEDWDGLQDDFGYMPAIYEPKELPADFRGWEWSIITPKALKNKDGRYWNKPPTNEQMEETPWP